MEAVSRIFPSQKLPFSKKGETWGKECIEGGIELCINSDNRIRQYYHNKVKNYDLYNDIIDLKDVEAVCSPLGFDMNTFPAKMQNYPLCNPKIKLLLGEEMKRRFEWKVICTNPNVISQKEKAMMDEVMTLLQEEIAAGETDENKLKQKLSSIQSYYKYDFQDATAKMASSLLNYFYKQQNLQHKFNRGFEDALVAGEEIYRIDIVQGEPKVTKCNPLNVFVYGNGLSNEIDDADLIVEMGYHSFGAVVDEFHDELTDNQVKTLEEEVKKISGVGSASYTNKTGTVNYKNFFPTLRSDMFFDEAIDSSTNILMNSFHHYDANGNILVMRVTWKSKRKVGKLKYFDQMTGEQLERFVDERYKLDPLMGETIEWLWINEYWEGIRIGKDIYVRVQPKPVQFRTMNNPSICKSGYVGTIYNVNESKGRSLYDQMKPYQYLYNIFMYRAELGFARFKFPIYEVNLSLIPDGWEPEKWLQYAEAIGYAFVDPFNEAKKGAATGQLAGHFNQFGSRVMESKAVGDYIQSNISMLQYIEKQIGTISGVSEQRQGQIETKELVGNVERAVSQSSHITEPWFTVHENTKLRVLSALLETAKYCLRNETDKRLFYILDDLSIKMAKVDGSQLSSSDFDIFITHSSKYIEFEQAVKQLAHAAMQNQMIGFKEVIQIYQANSIYDMGKIMENSEEQKRLQAEEAEANKREHEKQMQEQILAAQQEQQQRELENREDVQMHEILKIRIQGEEDRQTKILEKSLETPESNLEDIQLKMAEFDLKKQKMIEEIELKRKKQEEDSQKLESDKELNMKKLEQDRELAEKKLKQDKELKEKQIAVQRIKKKTKSD